MFPCADSLDGKQPYNYRYNRTTMASFDLSYQLPVSADVEVVFMLLTSTEGLNSWWTLKASGVPEPGAEYRWYFGPEHDWRAVVEHVIPGRHLTWRVTQAMDDWVGTTVGFSLSEADGGCILRFFHRGWPHDGDHYSVSNYCWGQLLRGLKELAENGTMVPFEQRS